MIVLISFVELGIVGYFFEVKLRGGGGEGKGDKRRKISFHN